MSLPRLYYALLALVALVGLAIEYGVTLHGHPGQIVGRTVIFLSFFTTLTNMLVMVASLGAALPSGRLHRWATRPATRAMVSLQITVVAVIFQLLLASLVHPTPIGWWGNMLVHQLVPVLWLIGWVLFHPHGGIGGREPWRWLIYPLVYGVWCLIHGAATGWYPYPFLNVATRGMPTVAINMVLMALFFAALGFAFRWMDGRLGRRAA
jgi:hypothetical protein